MDLIKRFDTFIFDFDGTIADTLPICFESFREVFKKYNGASLSNQTIESWFGPSEAGIIKNNISNPEDFEQAIALYYSVYEQRHDDLVRSHKEIIEMLNHLLLDGKKIAIVTGKGRKSFEISIDKLNLVPYFVYSVTGDDVIYPKPHPEGILKTLRHLNSEHDQSVYFGDSDADILAAKNSSIISVGVQWFYDKKFSYPPDFVSKTPMDILV